MRATTIKVEGDLLAELQRIKPGSQSLSGYVRLVLKEEILRRKMTAAAERYAQFLQGSTQERTWLEEWDHADLATPVTRKRR